MNVYFSQTISMVHEVQKTKIFTNVQMQVQVRKSTGIKQIELIFLTNLCMDNFFNESKSIAFIRFPKFISVNIS